MSLDMTHLFFADSIPTGFIILMNEQQPHVSIALPAVVYFPKRLKIPLGKYTHSSAAIVSTISTILCNGNNSTKLRIFNQKIITLYTNDDTST